MSIVNAKEIMVEALKGGYAIGAASGVTPSAACDRMDAVGLRLNSDESSPDMIIISSPIMRA